MTEIKKSKSRILKYILVALLIVFAWGLVDTEWLFTEHYLFSKCFVSMLIGSNLGFFLMLLYKRKEV